MKIHIVTKLKGEAWGGGNQFLRALRQELLNQDCYTNSPESADTLIFNSYQDVFSLIVSRFKYPNKKRIYRLGPIFYLHRGIKWKVVDYFVILAANSFANLIIFQSKWSYNQALKLGLNKNKKHSIIVNAVDGSVFFGSDIVTKRTSNPINLIYTSWSSNPNKGFSYLDFLDKNLDFDRYKMKFIGNSPVAFKNIEIIKPLTSVELGKALRDSDIYISPTKDDACSNAILEALACGLPVIALDSGANSELVGQGGLLFHDNRELLDSIIKVSEDIEKYRNGIVVKGISEVSREYLVAIKNLHGSIDLNK